MIGQYSEDIHFRPNFFHVNFNPFNSNKEVSHLETLPFFTYIYIYYLTVSVRIETHIPVLEINK